MEPPNKRSRFGPAPFDDDDSEADELNSRPEEVNARRDPGLRLERSRAFAAFKLKSAFERIFEKYEKDFTGIGDEIDLRTGEIVVNNGHIQSLKDAQMGGADDEENSEHTASEAGSPNEEARHLQGKADALPLIPPQAGSSPFFGRGWPAPAPLLGGHPRFSATMIPGQMQFGSFPMQYGAPAPASATDPAWSAPELPSPSPFLGNGVVCGETGTPLLKKARMSLAASLEHGGDEEDEILLKLSTASQNGEKNERVVIRKKLLLPRSPAGQLSAKKKKRPSITTPKRCHNAATQGKGQSTRKTPEEKPLSKRNRATPESGRTHLGASPTRLGRDSQIPARDIDPQLGPIPAEKDGLTDPIASSSGSTNHSRNQVKGKQGLITSATEAMRQGSSQDSETETNEVAAVSSRPSNQAIPVSDTSQPEELDVYLDLSWPEGKFTRKPRNQILRVELAARTPADIRSFQVLTPEMSNADSPRSPEIYIPEERRLEEAPIVSEAKDTSPHEPNRKLSPEVGGQARVAPVEVFSRNVVDPAYSFSDEDEPTLPSRKAQKPIKVTRARHQSPEAICQSMDAEVIGHGGELLPGEPLPDPDYSAPVGAGSPTLSAQLDDNVGSHVNDLGEPSTEGRDAPQALSSVAEGASDGTTSAPGNPQKTRKPKGKFLHEPGESVILQQDSELSPTTVPLGTNSETEEPSSSKRKRSPSNEAQQQGTRTRTASESSLTESKRYEGPQAPSDGQEVHNISPARRSRARVLEIPDSDPPISAGDLDRAPSPTLTDPSFKAQAAESTSIPKQPATSSKPPSTPVKKTTNRRRSKPSQPPPSTSAPPTAGTKQKQRRGVLSLVPDDGDDGDDEGADELSITPRSTYSLLRPPPDASATLLPFRTSPAAHHVRVSLLRTPSGRKRRNAAGGRALGDTSPLSSSSKEKVRSGTAGRGEGGEGEGEGELVQTPRGTMRRCGEGEFRCGRDFCFVCL
ncbi:hypothetical protein MFIFM68171_01257 [Madurella fahalii]|uniref:Uncharacterized protein n=1 Tax=Madurella fahalii TaxID=1157608 RepID=A0ABQ0FZW6_9PEZI